MKNKIFILFIVSLSLLTGCMRDELDGQVCPSPDGTTQIALSIDDPSAIETYSVANTNERMFDEVTTYYDLYVLVFNSGGLYKGGEAVLQSSVTGANGDKNRTITTSVAISNHDRVVILANTGVTALPSSLVAGTSTIADINTAFPSSAWSINRTGTDSGKGMPMSGTIADFSSATATVQMYRSVAKVQLSVSATVDLGTTDIASFSDATVTWALANDAQQGAIYSTTPEPAGAVVMPSANTFHTVADADFTRYGKTSTGLNVWYTPEYRSSILARGVTVANTTFAANRACLVIKHDNKYYRLDLVERNADGSVKNYIDFKRNCHYTVTITKVRSEGYTPLTEALANPAGNLEYTVTVTGPNDNVVESNGQYAVALEYDKLVVFADASSEMTFKAKAILGEGLTTLPATNSITASSGIVLRGATSLTTSEQEIKFTMSGTSATITVKLGNIKRDIAITRVGALDAHYNHKTIAGSFSAVTWTRNDNDASITFDGTTSMTIHTKENVTPTNASALGTATVEPVFENKYAEGYVLSSVGRTKVMIEQTVPEYIGWFGGEPNQSGTTYYQKRLIVETVEEGPWDNTAKDYTGTLTMQWYSSAVATGPQDIERGKTNTQTIVGFATPTAYQAAFACWMKNDADGNGTVTEAEFAAAGWYLPAQNQLMGAWIDYPNFNFAWNTYNYWSSTEYSGTGHAWNANFFNGYMNFFNSKMDCYYVRCVREF